MSQPGCPAHPAWLLLWVDQEKCLLFQIWSQVMCSRFSSRWVHGLPSLHQVIITILSWWEYAGKPSSKVSGYVMETHHCNSVGVSVCQKDPLWVCRRSPRPHLNPPSGTTWAQSAPERSFVKNAKAVPKKTLHWRKVPSFIFSLRYRMWIIFREHGV